MNARVQFLSPNLNPLVVSGKSVLCRTLALRHKSAEWRELVCLIFLACGTVASGVNWCQCQDMNRRRKPGKGKSFAFAFSKRQEKTTEKGLSKEFTFLWNFFHVVCFTNRLFPSAARKENDSKLKNKNLLRVWSWVRRFALVNCARSFND